MRYRRSDAANKIGTPCWHDVEITSFEEIKALQKYKLVRPMTYCKDCSVFYQRKYAGFQH